MTLASGSDQVSVGTVLLPRGQSTIFAAFTDVTSGSYGTSLGSLAVTVVAGTPSVSLVSSAAGATVYGQAQTLTATVTGEPAPYEPTGTVTFVALVGPSRTRVTVGSAVNVTTGGAHPGVASLVTTLVPAGTAAVVADYSGDYQYQPTTSAPVAETVAPAPTTVTLSTPATYVGRPVAVTATVTSTTGAGPVGTVVVKAGGVVVATKAVTATHDQVSVTVTRAAAGTVPVVATFVPAVPPAVTATDFTGSTAQGAVAVDTYPTAFDQFFIGQGVTGVGQPTPATVIVRDALGVPTTGPGGNMTLVASTGARCVATLYQQPTTFTSDGVCDLTFQAVGLISVGATYVGHGDAGPATDAVTVTVRKLTPSVMFTGSSTDHWVAGEPITLSWDVRGPTSGGTVTIKNPITSVCTSTSLVGSCTVTYPPTIGTGADYFILEYSGNADFNPGFATVQGSLAACYVMQPPTVSPAGAGTVTVETTPNCDNGTGYVAGTPVQLLATPSGSYEFQEWANDGIVSANDVVFIHGDITPWAIFQEPCVTVTIGTSQPGNLATTAGFVYSPTHPDCPTGTRTWTYHRSGAQSGSFQIGSTVTVTERTQTLKATGYPAVLYGWTGVPAGQTGTTVKVPITGTTLVLANLGPACEHGFTVGATDGSTASTSTATNCTNGGRGYAQGTTVAVSTKASGSQYFVRWTGDMAVHTNKAGTTSSTGTVAVIGNNEQVVAVYGNCVSLSVLNANGNAQGQYGTVSVSPAGNCPTLGSGWYLPGTRVSLSAQATYQGITFGGWTGDPTPLATQAKTSVVVGSNLTLTADFYESFTCRTLSVGAIPPGSVAVATTFPFGTNGCPSGTYYDRWHGTTGSPVTFTATPTHGHPLLGWSLSTHKALATGGTKVVSYPGLGEASVGMTFLGTSSATAWACEAVNAQVDLVSPDGTSNSGAAPATGTFIDASPPTDCPIHPDAYTVGTVVAPAANATTHGYKFVGWSGAESGTTPDPPGVTLNGTTDTVTVTATYDVLCYALTSDYTTGEIVAPAPNCPNTPASAHEYIGGTNVVMQATGHSTDNFDGWTGSPTGTQGTYAWVTMDKATAVYSDYTSKSVGQKIDDAFTSVGTDIAVAAKKAAGVAASVVSGLLVGGDPITAAASLAVLVGTGISDILSAVGVNTGGLAEMNTVLGDISQTINMMTASLNCATVWAANANTGSSTSGALLQQSGSVYAKTLIADKTGAAVDAEVYEEEAASQWEASQPYSLAGTPDSDLIPPYTTAEKLAASASSAADSASSAATSATRFAAKYGTRLGVAASAVSSIVSEASDGPGVGWDSTATAAWTGGASVYDSCLNAAEPSYFGTPPPSTS